MRLALGITTLTATKLSLLSTSVPLWTLALALCSPRAPAPVQHPDTTCAPRAGIQIGDLATHTFTSTIENGMGTQSLEDLRGKPLIVDFWGVRCPACLGAAVPASLKLQETFGDDLQVLLVECQSNERAKDAPDAGVGRALRQKWLGGRAMWTSERPFDIGTGSLPACVLVGNDGRVLLAGNPTTLHKEIERQIVAQIDLRRSPPVTAEPVVRCAWSEFAKDRYARAFRAVSQAEAENAGDPVQLAAIARARSAFRARLEGDVARVRWLVDHAWYDEAETQLDALAAGLQGATEYQQDLADLRARLTAPELLQERRAARQLARLRARFYESGGDVGVAREVERFAEKHEATETGARALELVRLTARARSR